VMNTEQKVKELEAQVAPQYWPWFANYLIVKRAAQVGGAPPRGGCGGGQRAVVGGVRNGGGGV
jgi:hypothetical protein